MASLSLFPKFINPLSGAIGGQVTVLPDGVKLTTSVLEITINDAARIINLPAKLGVSLGTDALTASLASALQVALGPPGLTVEICDDG